MKEAIIIFTRVPVPGQTKTRLMPFLTGTECAELHKMFIRDIYQVCCNAQGDILIFHTPEDYEQVLKNLISENHMFLSQSGKDLGKRMKNAFETTFHLGYEKVILIGTDIPQITVDILNRAFGALDENDIVINPTMDGGYYLIGMTQEHEEIWNIKSYGTDTVLHDTLQQLRQTELKVAVGRVCSDIDTKEELVELYRELKRLPVERMYNTRCYLKKELGEKIQYFDDKRKNG